MNFLKNFRIDEVNAPVNANDSIDDNSDRLDMSGYEGVVFIVPITDSAATGVAALTVQQNTSDSDSGMAAVSGGSATATCTTNDDLNDTLLIVDVYRPLERYVQGVLTSATANIAYGNTIAIRYSARKLPITEGASVQASSLVVSPSEA
jgi:hypothetical protein